MTNDKPEPPACHHNKRMKSIKTLSRRDLLVGAVAAVPMGAFAMQNQRPPAFEKELVGQFVGVAHGKTEETKALLKEHPGLLNAVHDWGGGDFESAIGAASHVGAHEIVEHLIANGARTDIFVHTVMGDTAVVKPLLTRYPDMVNCKGPHGITLLRHAEIGGERSKEILDFIKSLKAQ